MKNLLCASIVFLLALVVYAEEIDLPAPKGDKPSTPNRTRHETDVRIPSPIQLLIELNDGSQVIGEPKIESLTAQTSLGKLDIPLRIVESIEFEGNQRSAIIQCQNGDRIQGTIEVQQFKLKTSFGDVSLPVAQIKRATMNSSGECWGQAFDGSEGISIPGNSFFHHSRRNDRVDSLPQPVRSCTWLFWIRTKQSGVATLISKDISGGAVKDFYLAMNDMYPPAPNKLSWVEGTSSIDFKWRSVRNINDGRWHHVAIIRDFDSSTIHYCIDGKMESPGRNPIMWEITNEQPLAIGFAANSNFEGELCDLRYCRQALKYDQILDAMKGRASKVDSLMVSMAKRMMLPRVTATDD